MRQNIIYSIYWSTYISKSHSITLIGSPKNSKNIITLITFIIDKKDRQCKAGRERFTPYQSEDPQNRKH